jgi:hypothetical protein
MLGFAAIAALPIADDEISDAEDVRLVAAATSGGTRLNSSHSGGERLGADMRGGTRIQIGS